MTFLQHHRYCISEGQPSSLLPLLSLTLAFPFLTQFLDEPQLPNT